jgi:predicted DNA-binding transcriptional regulator YafY
MHRCLAIIRRVQRGPASRDDLLRVMRRVEQPARLDALDCAEMEALRRRLEKDLGRIRERLLVDVYYDDQVDGYVIKDTWRPLLDLPDEDLETMAWLGEAFDHRSPKHDQVHSLLRRLRLFLDPERVAVIEQARTALEIDLRQRDEDEIRPEVWEKLTKAFMNRQQVELVYLSPAHEEHEARRHVVEPYQPYYFDTTRGHYYLRAYCRRVDGPHGTWHAERYITYRLGRILEANVLPTKLSPVAPSSPRYRVVYELAPEVARLGVTQQRAIEVETVERRDDGSVMVHGETESVFWAVQALLHYGAQCRVVGGAEVRRVMLWLFR